MRKLIWQMMMSLDGYMEGPNHELDWHVTDEEFTQYVLEMFTDVDTLVFGRKTYQMTASVWPTAQTPEAPMMNALPKLVFSRTLKKVEWNNAALAARDPAQEIAKLKAQPGKNIAMIGSADLASTFMKLNLIDEYLVIVNPVVLGHGNFMFKDADPLSLKLIKTRIFHSGNVLLTYQPMSK